MHTIFSLILSIAVLIIFVSISTFQIISSGLSATFWVGIIIIMTCCSHIYGLLRKQQKQAEMVIRALANGDSTLGLSQDNPMRQQFDQVKDQMQVARFKAEQQAQFLQALLIHIDLAVLVCNESGQVIESNPAVNKLLGYNIKHLNDLGEVGALMLSSHESIRTTTHWLAGEQQDTLSIQLSIAHIQGELRRVISLQSIYDQLQLKEQQAYKRLTKVLTHEIANSITPLASLANTCTGLLPTNLCFDDEEDKQDLQLALDTLASRTQHLGDFIARFRQISSLPLPNLAPQNVAELLKRIINLHQHQAEQLNIEIRLNIQCEQLVMLDSSLIEQVVINLVKNALDALNNSASRINEDKKHITLTLGQNNIQQLYIEVTDNGTGIHEHVVEMIFVPFFTTKQQGSGIGLSLSKQIMLNHGGDLVYVVRDKGACFRCIFG